MARGLTYDGPRPTWDAIADQMVTYFEQRTGAPRPSNARSLIAPHAAPT